MNFYILFLRLLLIASILLLLFFDKTLSFLNFFVEKFISNDGLISLQGTQIIRFNFFFFLIILFIVGIFSFSLIRNTTYNYLKKILNYSKLYQFIFKDYHKRNSISIISFFLINLTSFLFILIYVYTDVPHEGFFESISAIIYLISFILMIFSLFLIKDKNIFLKYKGKIAYSILFLAAIIFFICGEELSWGQHFLNIVPNSFFQNYNFQHETNIHNFFNPLLKTIYLIFAVFLAIFCLSIWFFSNAKKTDYQIILEPHPNLIILLLLLIYSAGHSGELLEIQFSLFCFSYALGIILHLQHLRN